MRENPAYLPGEEVDVFYFGVPGQQLFGVYHHPPPNVKRACAVVLCPSIEQEAIRSHRAYRQMAVRLARAGYPTLRFDYWATGDSGGDGPVSGLGQWLGDLTTAVAEVRQRSQIQQVALVGLRLGGALATLAAQQVEIAGLALWEPVISGDVYLEDLMAWHQEKLWYFLSDVPDMNINTQPSELLSLAISPTLFTDLRNLDLLALSQRPARQVLLVEHAPEPQVESFKAQLQQWETDVQHQIVDDPRVWSDDPDKALVPNQALQAIVTWFTERFA